MYCDECKDQAASEKGNLIVEMSKVADERDRALLQLSEAQKYAAPMDAKASVQRLNPCEHSEYWTTHYGNCMACRAVDAERLNRDLWWLLENEPSGPGEGMVSTPEDVKLQREWAEKYEMVRAGIPIQADTEKRKEGS